MRVFSVVLGLLGLLLALTASAESCSISFACRTLDYSTVDKVGARSTLPPKPFGFTLKDSEIIVSGGVIGDGTLNYVVSGPNYSACRQQNEQIISFNASMGETMAIMSYHDGSLQIFKSKRGTCQQPYNNVAKSNWRQQEW